jgi:phage head maturation protease
MAISPADYNRLSDLADDKVYDMDEATRATYALRFIERDALGVAQLDAYIATEVFNRLCAEAEDVKAERSIAA